MDTIRKVRDLLDARERLSALLVLAMIVIMAILETGGVVMIVPFVAVLANPGLVETNRYLHAVYAGLGFTNHHSFFVFLGVALFLATLASTAFKALTTWAMLRFNNMRQYTLSCRLFSGFLNQPYGWFFNRHGADLGNTVLTEVGEVVTGTLAPAMQLMAQATVAGFLIMLLVIADPRLAFILTLVIGGSYGTIFWASRKYLARIGKDRVRSNRERFRVSIEAFSGIKDVKARGLESVFLDRFENPMFRFAQARAASQMFAQLPQYGLESIAFGGILLVVLYQLLTQGSLGQALPIIALYAVAGQRLMPALQRTYQQVLMLRFSKPALDTLHRDLIENGLDAPSPRSQEGITKQSIRLQQSVELRNVTYRYPKSSTAALDHITITIPARTTVGLVGRTGSGKTTTVDLILGLLSPSSGSLFVDGTAISERNRRAWCRSAGYVPQHIFLADDTVASNIAFGVAKDKIDHNAVQRAARIANLHDFVVKELERGYETFVGERGIRLSGGQRQRIGIARALYHDPDLLIMDEATSALDTITERAVMDAVANLEHQKTIVLVAHRLSTVKRCDVILVLDRGRVVASGSYLQLLTSSHHFQKLVSDDGPVTVTHEF